MKTIIEFVFIAQLPAFNKVFCSSWEQAFREMNKAINRWLVLSDKGK